MRLDVFDHFEWPLNFLIKIGKLLNERTLFMCFVLRTLKGDLFHRKVAYYYRTLLCMNQILYSSLGNGVVF